MNVSASMHFVLERRAARSLVEMVALSAGLELAESRDHRDGFTAILRRGDSLQATQIRLARLQSDQGQRVTLLRNGDVVKPAQVGLHVVTRTATALDRGGRLQCLIHPVLRPGLQLVVLCVVPKQDVVRHGPDGLWLAGSCFWEEAAAGIPDGRGRLRYSISVEQHLTPDVLQRCFTQSARRGGV